MAGRGRCTSRILLGGLDHGRSCGPQSWTRWVQWRVHGLPAGTSLAATDCLTEGRIRSARPKARPYKLRDGGGLYVLITPKGAKQWRLRYTLCGEALLRVYGRYLIRDSRYMADKG